MLHRWYAIYPLNEVPRQPILLGSWTAGTRFSTQNVTISAGTGYNFGSHLLYMPAKMNGLII